MRHGAHNRTAKVAVHSARAAAVAHKYRVAGFVAGVCSTAQLSAVFRSIAV